MFVWWDTTRVTTRRAVQDIPRQFTGNGHLLLAFQAFENNHRFSPLHITKSSLADYGPPFSHTLSLLDPECQGGFRRNFLMRTGRLMFEKLSAPSASLRWTAPCSRLSDFCVKSLFSPHPGTNPFHGQKFFLRLFSLFSRHKPPQSSPSSPFPPPFSLIFVFIRVYSWFLFHSRKQIRTKHP